MSDQTVLLVEDDPDTRTVLAMRLAAELVDVRIIAAESAEAALELSARERPTVVVLDLGLAGMDGFDFARRVGVKTTVALTGDARLETRQRAEREGFAGFFVKPAGVDEVVAVVRRLLR